MNRFVVMSRAEFWTSLGWSDDPAAALAFEPSKWPDPWQAAADLAAELSEKERRPCVVAFIGKSELSAVKGLSNVSGLYG